MNLDNYESWGRYPKVRPAEVFPLFWRNELPGLAQFDKKVLAYAWGKSYGDSCLNENGVLLDTKGLNKLIAFDKENGIIRCEAGVTLSEVLDFVIPHGYFLTVTPGTKYVSVAGAVANDVHGKNHHIDGTFGMHVTKFELVRSDGTVMICSPEENTEMFSATIGGLGLTGLITWVEFRLKKSPTPFFYTESIKFGSLDEFFDINKDSEKTFDYTVSWVDTTGTGAAFGRGIYNRGNMADPAVHDIPKLPAPRSIPMPIEAPFINYCTVLAFNILYYNKQLSKKISGITHFDPFFYPLDAVLNWNRAYGKDGFLQYQFVVPFGSGRKAIEEILRFITLSGLSSFLTVLKTFGDKKSPGMLSFPRPGITMAVDFRFSSKTLDLLSKLDVLVKDAGGVLYPAKDARMSGEDYRQFYPQWEDFTKYIDPKFSSSFWRRVTEF